MNELCRRCDPDINCKPAPKGRIVIDLHKTPNFELFLPTAISDCPILALVLARERLKTDYQGA